MVDYSINEQRIAQQLTARNLSKLFELLLGLKGLSLNQHYTLRWLYAVGGQSVLYMAEGLDEQMAIVKMPLLPYHRAAYISIEDIHQARQRLEYEANLLQRFLGTVLPKFYDLVYAVNPLYSSARGEEVINREPYLVMEYIEGHTLIEITRGIHRHNQPLYEALEWLAWQVASVITHLSIKIAEQEPFYLYSDFTPLNVILTRNLNEPVRILDAGSLIPFQADPGVLPPFTWAYIPPKYYEAFDKGKVIWPTPGYVMYTIGKVLWEVLTNRQPYPAEDPDLNEPKLKNYSASLQSLLFNLIKGQYENFAELEQALQSKPNLEEQSASKLVDALNDAKEVPLKKGIIKNDIPVMQFSKPTTMQLTRVYKYQFGPVQKVRYSPDGRYLALAGRQRIELWDAQTFRPLRNFNLLQSAQVVSLDFDATGTYLASGSVEGRICLWQVDSDDPVWQHQDKGINGPVALNAQGDFLAAATEWSAHTFNLQFVPAEERHFEAMTDQGNCVAIAKQKSLLAVGGLWGIRLWDIQTHSQLGKLRVGRDLFVGQITFSNGEVALAALCFDMHLKPHSSIMIWDVSSLKLLWRVEIPSAKVTEFRLDSEGRLVFAGSLNGDVWIWDRKQDALCAQLVEQGKISSLDFASDQQMLTTATSDGEICIYQLNE